MTTPLEPRQDGYRTGMPSRRGFITFGIGAFVVATMPFAARRRTPLVRRSVPSMGSVAELAVAHRDAAYANAAIDAAVSELHRIESLMTRFRADSDIGRINAAEPGTAVRVNRETARLLADALGWAERSDGAFDPALGRAVELWDVQHRHAPPPPHAVRHFAGRRLYRSIDVARVAGGYAVVRNDADVAIDLGGIAKGYAVDAAAGVLREWGVFDGLVNAGGDLYALGVAPDGEPWRVGVRAPGAANGVVATLAASDVAIATSGDYEQHFEFAGRRYHHLLDPATGEPRLVAAHSLTIRAASCLAADAAATARFGAPDATAATRLATLDATASIAHRG
jgi:FAD:protein FMN transferase